MLARLDGLVVEGGRARPGAAADPLADHAYVAALEAGLFSPPEPDGVDRAELSELVRRGLVVERDGTCFAPAAVSEAARRLAVALAAKPEGVTVAEVRDVLGTTRTARPAAAGPSRRHGRHPPPGRPPHRRPPPAPAGGLGQPARELELLATICLRSSSLRPPQMPCGSWMLMA